MLNRLKVRNDYFKKLIVNELKITFSQMEEDLIDQHYSFEDEQVNIPAYLNEYLNTDDPYSKFELFKKACDNTPIKRYTQFNSKFDFEPILICRRLFREVEELRTKLFCKYELDSSSDEEEEINICSICNTEIQIERFTWGIIDNKLVCKSCNTN
tara:strand:- start:4919 stop:5383 length:465 start_codon:yes stop_codon:yes gene_type:complete